MIYLKKGTSVSVTLESNQPSSSTVGRYGPVLIWSVKEDRQGLSLTEYASDRLSEALQTGEVKSGVPITITSVANGTSVRYEFSMGAVPEERPAAPVPVDGGTADESTVGEIARLAGLYDSCIDMALALAVKLPDGGTSEDIRTIATTLFIKAVR